MRRKGKSMHRHRAPRALLSVWAAIPSGVPIACGSLALLVAQVCAVEPEAGAPVIAAVHRTAALPPLLTRLDGTPVRSVAAWQQRRQEISDLMCQYFIGTFPDTVPRLLEAEIVDQQVRPDRSMRRRVKLTFETPNRASFEIRIWIPPGEGPFPVLLTQPLTYQMGWAEAAHRRGYLVVFYPGADSLSGNRTVFPGYHQVHRVFQREYPQASWTEISTKAWIASRTLDYLLDPRQDNPIAAGHVAIIGHSRHGKQSLIAAAFDTRITSVVARSAGSPGSCPYRFTSRNTCAEAPADFPDPWFRSSLKSYTGREHDLPIDAHGWLALIAPRPCLLDTAHNDGSDPTFAVERAYLQGSAVYALLGKPEHLRVSYRSGQHNPITDRQRQRNIDWFDLSFGRGAARQADFPETLLHQFDWQAWKQTHDPDELLWSPAPADPDHAERRRRVLWMLGQPPDQVVWEGQYTFLTDAESAMMTHDRWSVAGTRRLPVSFGENVRGNIYYNPQITSPAGAVIWLHPYSYHSGYNEGYGVQGTTVYHRLARAGFVVLAYDQCGFGLRLLEGRDFYQAYPKWSKLGRMVHDVHAAVDFLGGGTGVAQGQLPAIDQDRIYVLGFALGGNVGLHAAALDKRIAGVASFGGFTPLRTDTDRKRTGGIRRLWQWHALQPRLGLFHNREQQIPYDYDDLAALIAPRPCLVYAPQRDRDSDAEDLRACIERARLHWRADGHPDRLVYRAPDDINRFQKDQQELFLDWLNEIGR